MNESVLLHCRKHGNCIALITLGLLVTACGGGGGGGGGTTAGPTTTTGVASLGTMVKNVPLTTGMPTTTKFTFTIPGDMTKKGDFAINVPKTLQSVTLSANPIASAPLRFDTYKMLAGLLIKEAFAQAASSSQITAFISYAGDPNVCSSPYQFGPYTVAGMIGSTVSSATSSVAPSQPVVDITNSGALEVCVVTVPQFTGFVTVPNIAVDFETCAASTLDIAGTWTGNFQCTNFDGSPGGGGPISLSITKNADGSYSYTDGTADYNGNLCGNKFRHSGAARNGTYTESGTFDFASSASGTKTSTWTSVPAGSGGNCSDTLIK